MLSQGVGWIVEHNMENLQSGKASTIRRNWEETIGTQSKHFKRRRSEQARGYDDTFMGPKIKIQLTNISINSTRNPKMKHLRWRGITTPERKLFQICKFSAYNNSVDKIMNGTHYGDVTIAIPNT